MTGFKELGINPREYVGGRIMMIIKHYELNRNSFSLKIGMTNNSLITRITNHVDMGMSLDLIQKILRAFPNVNPEWFILGEGEMLRLKNQPDPRFHYIKYIRDGDRGVYDVMRIHGFEDCDFAFDLIGAGMTPRYQPGDVLICKKIDINSNDLIFGEAYLIVLPDDKRMLRYIKGRVNDTTFKLGAEDSRYEDSTIDQNNIQSLYLVKGLVRKEVL